MPFPLVVHADVRVNEEVATLETLAPANVIVPLASTELFETPLALGVLALALIDSSSILMVWFWLLGLGFSVYGLFRTKNGNLRGRKLAVWGVVLFGISPLALLIGVVTGHIGIS